MEEHIRIIESIVEKASAYGKTSLKLAKYKALDKTANMVSTLIPALITFLLLTSLLLFISLGAAFWLGILLGSTFLGFYLVGAFYGFTAVIFRLFMYKWIQKKVCNSFINKALK